MSYGEDQDILPNIDNKKEPWILSDNILAKWNKPKLKLLDKVLEIRLKVLVSHLIQHSRNKEMIHNIILKELMN